MKAEIQKNLNNPKQLEILYQKDKVGFKQAFNSIYSEIQYDKAAAFWYERLNYENPKIYWEDNSELTFVIVASLFAGFFAKLPTFTGIDANFFYPRNMGFFIFPILINYFTWKNNLSIKRTWQIFTAILVSITYINIFPNDNNSSTFILAVIHMPLFLWSLLGVAYVGNSLESSRKRIDFLRYNGDMVVLTVLILIAGMVMTFITMGLFSAIELNISDFYRIWIVVFGLVASPIVATYITQTNPQLVSKVSPVIAKIFSPLVLITLVAYLIAIVYSGKDPYNDREFLLIFNFLLIGVMAIIFFSIAESSHTNESRVGIYILFALSAVAIMINVIALSAIVFRISEWGISPNKLAVLGGNLLMLTNLLAIGTNLLKTITRSASPLEVENSIAKFLPIYSLWTIIVTFLFPLIFQFE